MRSSGWQKPREPVVNTGAEDARIGNVLSPQPQGVSRGSGHRLVIDRTGRLIAALPGQVEPLQQLQGCDRPNGLRHKLDWTRRLWAKVPIESNAQQTRVLNPLSWQCTGLATWSPSIPNMRMGMIVSLDDRRWQVDPL